MDKYKVSFQFKVDGEWDQFTTSVNANSTEDAYDLAFAKCTAEYGGDFEEVINVRIDLVMEK